MAELAGEFLARLDPAEAAIAARFMVGRALEQGEEKPLQISGRAIWKIVAAATDFGEAIEMLLRLRPTELDATLTLAEVERCFIEIAGIEGRNSRRRKL